MQPVYHIHTKNPSIYKRKGPMLVKMLRNWNPCTLFVGMSNGAATVEKSTVVPQKIKNRIPI